jgi:hypothetical protein
LRVKYAASKNNEENEKILGRNVKITFPNQMNSNLIIGKEYIVYGLSILSGTPWIYILNNAETYIYSEPLSLFEIIDSRVSKYWEIRTEDDGTLFFWPHSFFQPYYHDDLSEGIPEVVKDFQRVKELIDAEANS